MLESQSRAGGSIGSGREQGYLVESGPNSALDTTPLIARLLEETGIAGERIAASPAAAKRYILRDAINGAANVTVDSIATRSVFAPCQAASARGAFIGATSAAEETVAGFCAGGSGPNFSITPSTHSWRAYTRATPSLERQSGFCAAYELEQAHGSLIRGSRRGAARERNPEKSKHAAPMFAFRDGMQTLTDAIADKLARVELATAAIKSCRSRLPFGYCQQSAWTSRLPCSGCRDCDAPLRRRRTR